MSNALNLNWRLALQERLARDWIPEPNSGCWLWLKGVDKDGYGKCWWEGATLRAHRLAWEAHCGPIAEGFEVLHRCDMPGCVNPGHLFLGTNMENNKDKKNKGRHCYGENHNKARLTAGKVLAIRADPRSHAALSREHGVSLQAIWALRNGRTWKHV